MMNVSGATEEKASIGMAMNFAVLPSTDVGILWGLLAQQPP
jgi:hypothetical protein